MQKSRLHLLLSSVFLICLSCEYKDIPRDIGVVDCSHSNLSVSVFSKRDASACNLIDGSVTVAGAGGTGPYTFSINEGAFQASTTFSNLGPGIYTIQVQDAAKCIRSVDVNLFGGSSDFDLSIITEADSECLTDNGSFSVTAKGGKAPYLYQFESSDFVTKTKFDSLYTQHLKNGAYNIAVKDANGCPKSANVVINRSITGVSFAATIKPIVDTKCAISGCHNGDNGPTRNWTIFSLFQKNAQNVKIRTGNKSMPLVGHLTDDEIQLIACWVDDGALDN